MKTLLDNPIHVNDKIVVSFSGGRTSAYMLHCLLQRYDKDKIIAVFANTGKECEETLEFVRDCSINWGIPITWVELSNIVINKKGRATYEYKVTDFINASRKGEPFAMLIKHKHMLPSVAKRFCTESLKIYPIRKYLRDTYKATGFLMCIGIRFDEERRIRNAKKANKKEPFNFTHYYPLYEMGSTVADVNTFWQAQDFNLQIDSSYGNCDLCFLKSKAKLITILKNKPELSEWWIDMSDEVNKQRVEYMDNPIDIKWGIKVDYIELLEMSKQVTKDYSDSDSEDLQCFCGL